MMNPYNYLLGFAILISQTAHADPSLMDYILGQNKINQIEIGFKYINGYPPFTVQLGRVKTQRRFLADGLAEISKGFEKAYVKSLNQNRNELSSGGKLKNAVSGPSNLKLHPELILGLTRQEYDEFEEYVKSNDKRLAIERNPRGQITITKLEGDKNEVVGFGRTVQEAIRNLKDLNPMKSTLIGIALSDQPILSAVKEASILGSPYFIAQSLAAAAGGPHACGTPEFTLEYMGHVYNRFATYCAQETSRDSKGGGLGSSISSDQAQDSTHSRAAE